MLSKFGNKSPQKTLILAKKANYARGLMKKLIQGIVDFRNNLTEEKRSLFSKLALGQKPDVLFVA